MTRGRDAQPDIEVLRPDFPRGDFRAVLFDFDGTLSLIRRNWQDVMIPMMVDVLTATPSSETREQLTAVVEDYVMRLNGRQTIYQMMQLGEEVNLRGGQALEPLAYKHQYHELLWRQVGGRVADLKTGRATPEEMAVPGAHQLLTALIDAGLPLFLASGTDLKYVRDELDAIAMSHFFGPRVFGALDAYQDFSKAQIIRRIISEHDLAGHQLLAFGDGFVEIEEVRRVGGLAVGVASEEEKRSGVNTWKRDRLIRAGADVIIGDYRRLRALLDLLGIDRREE